MSDKDENENGGSPTQADRKAELMALLASLSPSEKRALLGVPTEHAALSTPKMSTAIDAIPVGERVDVIRACAATLKAQSDPKEFAAAFSKNLQARWPELAFAMANNSSYRGKPLTHSLRVVVEALTRKDA